MTTRTSRRDVTFRAPFTLGRSEAVHPAGAYIVETDEEFLQELSFPAWRRVATSLVLPTGRNSYQMLRIDPAELAAAEERDAAG